MERVTANLQHRSPDSGEQSDLRTVVDDLKSIAERLQSIAGSLAPQAVAASRRLTSGRLETARQQLWGLAGELVGARARLGWFGEGLRMERQPAGSLSGEDDLDESAVLLSVIECVLADSLAPAIRSLLKAAGHRLPDESTP